MHKKAQNRIKELRNKKNLTLMELSKKVGYRDSTISQYETGVTKTGKPEIWQKLADYFGVSVDYLKGYGYSKEYIYNLLLNACHDDWDNYGKRDKDQIGQEHFLDTFNSEIVGQSALDNISDYCTAFKVKVPTVQEIKYDFWNDNFSFIFDTEQGKWLSKTKDILDKDTILTIVFQEIQLKTYIKFVNDSKEEITRLIQNKEIAEKLQEKVSYDVLADLVDLLVFYENNSVSKKKNDTNSDFFFEFYNVVNEYFDSLNK